MLITFRRQLMLAVTAGLLILPVTTYSHQPDNSPEQINSPAPLKSPKPPSPSQTTAMTPAKLSIIIDDLGYQEANCEQLLAMNSSLTFSVIPTAPKARQVAKKIAAAKRELMLHLPMEPLGSLRWENGLTSALPKPAFENMLIDMLDQFPAAKGVNNHGGSMLTQFSQPMDWVMQALKVRNLYFIDSRTTALSVAIDSARLYQLRFASRDIFLDNNKDPAAILDNLNNAITIAHEKGQAIAIGHPYPATIEVLRQTLPTLHAQGIELVPASATLNK